MLYCVVAPESASPGIGADGTCNSDVGPISVANEADQSSFQLCNSGVLTVTVSFEVTMTCHLATGYVGCPQHFAVGAM